MTELSTSLHAGQTPALPGKKFFGRYRGIVVLIDENQALFPYDRQQRGRLRALIPAVLGNQKLSSWARPSFPLAAGRALDPTRQADEFGVFYMPRPGDMTWIEFEQGDPAKPIWTGCFYPPQDDVGGASIPGIPKRARGQDDGTLSVPSLAPAKTYAVGPTGAGSDFVEVEAGGRGLGPDLQVGNDAASRYPYNMVFRSRAGTLIEIDDSVGSVRVRVRHPSGSQIQMRNDGSIRVFTPAQLHLVSDGKMVVKAPVVELGARDLLDASAGCMTGRTQPVCQVTGKPLSFSRSVRANS